MQLYPKTPNQQRLVNLIVAWSWFSFGILGLVDYVLHLGIGIAKSIPILFFISVYANFVAHLASAAGNKAQTKVDETDGHHESN